MVLLATGLVPPAVAGLLAAGMILISGVLSVEQVYRSINWTTVILVGAMMPLSTAMEQTGAAQPACRGSRETSLGMPGRMRCSPAFFCFRHSLGR